MTIEKATRRKRICTFPGCNTPVNERLIWGMCPKHERARTGRRVSKVKRSKKRKSLRLDALPNETEQQYEIRNHCTPREVQCFLQQCNDEEDAQAAEIERVCNSIADSVLPDKAKGR